MIADWQEVLYWVTIASITLANLFAIRQQNLKRLMAFSSISQAGYIMLGVIGGTADGMSSLVYYVLVYAVANLGVFAVITIVALRSISSRSKSMQDFINQSEISICDDPIPILTGRYSAICRVLFQILYLHVCVPGRFPLTGIYRFGQYGHLIILLPSDSKGNVHYSFK